MEDLGIKEALVFVKCLEIAHWRGIDTESAIKCTGENECDDCPYSFDGE